MSLYKLLEQFDHSDSSSWLAASLVGANFADAAVRLKARTQCLQLAAGICDAFELRMSRAPYSLCVVNTQAPADVKDKAVDAFMDEREACIPLFCKRLRAMCPSKQHPAALGADIIECWSQATIVSIDESERAHAMMRTDLSSSGPGRSPTASSNRCFCKEVRAAHEAAGGKIASPANYLEDDDCKQARVGRGGSPKLEHLNAKRRAFKALRAPNRQLTADERRQCDELARKEWAEIEQDHVELGMWRARYSASRLARVRAAECVPLGNGDEAPEFTGLWGHVATPCDLLPSETLQQHGLLQRFTAEQESKVWNDDRLLVKEANARIANIGAHIKIDGCFGDKKNVCRDHRLAAGEKNRFEQLARSISALVDHLGKQAVAQADTLVRFVGRRADIEAQPARATLTCLLLYASYKPKMQYWARCHLTSRPSCDAYASEECPYTVSISSRAPRLPSVGDKRVVDIITSDELCRELLGRRPLWEYGVEAQEVRCDVPTLWLRGHRKQRLAPLAPCRPSSTWTTLGAKVVVQARPD